MNWSEPMKDFMEVLSDWLISSFVITFQLKLNLTEVVKTSESDMRESITTDIQGV